MVATRYVVDAAGPASLGFLRYFVGLLCLAPALLLAPWRHIAGRDLLPIALLGVGQFGLLIVLLNYSLLHIPAGRASLLFATFPLMTMLLSALLGREEMTRRRVAGSLLTFPGGRGGAGRRGARARLGAGLAVARDAGGTRSGSLWRCVLGLLSPLRRALFSAARDGLRDARRCPHARRTGRL